ncbi:MAG: hypothetical protein HC894_20725, partial [Microcoleus sp. SM1_3_4]|nr:hypothetical protein [Microcoleus sp. SM1_3_4]
PAPPPPAPHQPPQPAFTPPQEPEPIAARGPETPAESAISAMVRGQQAYVTRNRSFLNVVASMARSFTIPLPQDYDFAIRRTTRGAFHYAIPRSPNMKAYVGAVFLQDNATLNNPSTVSIVCEATVPQNIRPADPTFSRGKLACGNGTEPRSASNFPQQNSAVVPAPAPATRTNPPQTRASQSSGFVSLVNVCNTFDLSGKSPHQERALEWLQSKISASTMQNFAQEWRSQLIARASNRPINLIDVCKVYDRAGMHPHQNRALEWLQQQIPRETLTDFGKKWQEQAIGGS